MRVLITNIWLVNRGGTEVYVRDLAIGLQKRGIQVDVYSPELGTVAEEISRAGINVVDTADKLQYTPDIIHAHHFTPTLEVLLRFPGVPAVYLLHGRTHPTDTPPKHSQIVKYMAVDYNCLDRIIIDEGIQEKHTGVMYNWVDTSRFKLRDKWSDKPKRALVFSNYATRDNYFLSIEEACRQSGLELDGLGLGFNNSIEDPEDKLMEYDIVFAKAKAAMEALATGATVILCDSSGLGETVTSQNFNYLRKYNFGMKTLSRPIEKELIIKEIEKYNSEETKAVSRLIREDSSFMSYLDKILNTYHEAIKKYQRGEKIYDDNEEKTLAKYIEQKKVLYTNELNHKASLLDNLNAKLVAQNDQINNLEQQLNNLNHQKSIFQSEIENLHEEINRINASLSRRMVRWIIKQFKKY